MDETDKPTERVVHPILIDVDEAAQMLGITRAALYQRIFRHQVAGIVRTGRRVQFHRERLLAWLDRKAR